MQLHQIQRKTKAKKSAQVGRGGKRGKTSGRGTKGQKARAGHKIRPEIRDVIKRLPKLRGRGVNSLKSFQERPVAINLSDIEAVFSAGDIVSPQTLIGHGLTHKKSGRYPRVKILAGGTLTKKVIVSGCETSVAAKALIEKAGGGIK